MMLTSRGWWLLFAVLFVLVLGLLRPLAVLTILGLALLFWLGAEWLLFTLRVRFAAHQLELLRTVGQEGERRHQARSNVVTVWIGHTVAVHVRLMHRGAMNLPYLAMTDRLPFGVEYAEGITTTEGSLSPLSDNGLEMHYRIHCPRAGLMRFEGVHIQIADLHGLFYHSLFLRVPVHLRVLPKLVQHKGRLGSAKQHNTMPPPGIHRMHRPGSGSELLDLRDYLPGDPPKTIAWKVSARRDRLITKEFESEVPVRCTLFVDTSRSVRPIIGTEATESDKRRPRSDVPATPARPLDRLLELTAGVVQANMVVRDLTGLCLVDEHGSTVVPPQRTSRHRMELLCKLADSASLTPISSRVDPEELLPLTHALAQQLYPELLHSNVNSIPFLFNWLDAVPGYARSGFSIPRFLHGLKRPLFYFLLFGMPLGSVMLSLVVLFDTQMAMDSRLWVVLLLSMGSSVVGAMLILFFLFILAITARIRRLSRWRKKLAALLSVHYGLAPGGLAALLEDDDQFALYQQRFLAEHRVPYALPLYDRQGRYQLAAPEKVEVLARALTRAVSRAHDNELFVLLVDLLELDEHLEPLLGAIRVALGRHHQVVLVCPWPPGLELPTKEEPAQEQHLRSGNWSLKEILEQATRIRLHTAYHRIRRSFSRLGVPVVCAGSDEPIPLILDRLERLRQAVRIAPR